MRIVERCTQDVVADGWAKVAEVERAFDAAEAALGGVPKKRRYLMSSGGLPRGTFIWERDWESMAMLDDYAARTASDKDFQAAMAQIPSVFTNGRFEILVHFDDL